ncbi:MAG: HAD family phosphatase [Alphaproteobacteria bacterium]|nr:HAD family phosphatase [Alphaproteobacteria bacterium]
MTDKLVPVFDIGGVFVDWNPLYLFRKLFDSEEEAVWFHDTIFTPQLNLEFDAGKPFAEGVAEQSARFPKYRQQILAFDERWNEMVGGYIADTIALHDELIDAGLPSYAITNFSAEKFGTIFETWPFITKFDGIVVSGMEGLIKPDYRIYYLFMDRFGLTPEQCVFIDDSEPNVVAARKLGMKACHFTGPGQLRKDLRALGLPLTE